MIEDSEFEALEQRVLDLEREQEVRPNLPFKLVDGAKLPRYTTRDAAGMDIASVEWVCVDPKSTRVVATGLYVEIPRGWELQVRPRSGLAAKHGVTVLNTPGTIDADYRGEIKVILHNHSDVPFSIHAGDRIAQLVLSRAIQAFPYEVKDISSTDRGAGGLGSTGIS